MPKISIIIPAHDVGKYIKCGLDSLINQTLRDIEIICIDDASGDDTLNIMREYEKRDPRVRVIAMERNGGAAIARNAGLAVATGEYLGFMDSDDYVDTDFYEKLYNAACESDADIVKGLAAGEKDITDRIVANKFNFFTQWWSAIYKHKMIRDNKIDFAPELITGQDLYFQMKCIVNCNKISTIDTTKYHYVRRAFESLDSYYSTRFKSGCAVKTRMALVGILNSYDNISRADYMVAYRNLYGSFLHIITKSTNMDTRLFLCESFVEFYKQCKYKGDFAEINDNIWAFVQSEDATGLMKFFTDNKYCARRRFEVRLLGLSLFGYSRYSRDMSLKVLYIPLLKIKDRINKRFICIFGIPLLRIREFKVK